MLAYATSAQCISKGQPQHGLASLIVWMPLSDVTQQSHGHSLLFAKHADASIVQELFVRMANGKRNIHVGTDGHAIAGMVVLMQPLTMSTATCQARR